MIVTDEGLNLVADNVPEEYAHQIVADHNAESRLRIAIEGLREIAALDHVDLRLRSYSVGDIAIGRVRAALKAIEAEA